MVEKDFKDITYCNFREFIAMSLLSGDESLISIVVLLNVKLVIIDLLLLQSIAILCLCLKQYICGDVLVKNKLRKCGSLG